MKAVKFTVRPASILKSLKVFEPVIIQANAHVVAFQKLLYVLPPHVKVTVPVNAHVNFIVEVPAFTVPVQFQHAPVVHVNV